MRYNPFKRPFSETDVTDLESLRTAQEGWYVEYKREVGNAKTVAKSISAMANQYGGWVFYGVEAPSSGDRTASGFPGVSTADIPVLLDRIRDAARHGLSPTPHFDVRVFDGPAEALGLPSGRSVVGIVVPEGSDAPYVHSDGCIYRRVADASHPKPETDRSSLDVLWQRGKERRERLAARLKRSALVSKAEEDGPFLYVFLLADPLGDRQTFAEVEFPEFVSTLNERADNSFSIPFDNAFSSARGFIARSTAGNSPYFRMLTWEYLHDGSSIVSIPLATPDPLTSTSYEHTHGLRSKLTGWTPKGIIDLNAVMAILAACLSAHHRLSKMAGVPTPYYAKARFDNVWRRVAFLDTPSYDAFVRKYGVPLIQDDTAFAPFGTEPESLLELDVPSDKGELNSLAQSFLLATPLFRELFISGGIPQSVVRDTGADIVHAAFRGITHLTENRAGNSRP